MPKKLMYRSTFISVQDVEDGSRRTRSVPPRLEIAPEDAESRYVSKLLQRRAASFPLGPEDEKVEDAEAQAPAASSVNDGSLAHPEVCGRPCVRFMHGTCQQGAACQFCHLEHTRPKGKLDKRQRHCFDSLSDQQVLSLLTPYIVSRSEDQGIADRMAAVISLLRQKLAQEPVASVPRSKSNFLRVILKRLTVARLIELVVQSQADAAFLANLDRELVMVRSGMLAATGTATAN
ncbi:unnamed protein product [Symbiodinium pilosum]|uniref:C3H1-type domain-containing protein n=1 Tax=Symbiodinium pilosum TaxID=2952 RepID=A0A812YHS3_SYMPI|nr:unnamed protein product [Symbiodinium pilosum]